MTARIIRPIRLAPRAEPDTRTLEEIYGALPFQVRTGVEAFVVIAASCFAIVVLALATGRI